MDFFKICFTHRVTFELHLKHVSGNMKSVPIIKMYQSALPPDMLLQLKKKHKTNRQHHDTAELLIG